MDRESSYKNVLSNLVICISNLALSPELQTQEHNLVLQADAPQAPLTCHYRGRCQVSPPSVTALLGVSASQPCPPSPGFPGFPVAACLPPALPARHRSSAGRYVLGTAKSSPLGLGDYRREKGIILCDLLYSRVSVRAAQTLLS